MKTLYFFLIFTFATVISYAQDSFIPVKKLGVTFSSFGENDVSRVSGYDLIGEPSCYGNGFYTVGLNYIQSVGKLRWLEFETGVEFCRHKIEIKPAPFIDAASRNEDFSILTIPLTLRANFLKYLFINGGFMINFDGASMPIDTQTGIGTLFGAGIKYDFKSGVGLFVNPYTKFYSLFPVVREENRQQIFESGFRFGVVYKLK